MGWETVLGTFFWLWLCFFGTASKLWKREVRNAVSRYAVCNDFTPAAFYIRKQSPVQWIIYLESGGVCSSIPECNDRYVIDEEGHNTTNELMSSSQLPASTEGRDLLSIDKEDNPTFHQFTHVMVPYCSSDLWLGQGNNSRFPGRKFHFHNDSSVNDFIFRGYTIFRSVIEDLMLDGLKNATEVLLVGSSAGGIGVLNHLRYVRSELTNATIAAIIDSSWFIDFEDNLAVRFNKEEAVDLSQFSLLPACQYDVLGYPCCISAKCMLQSRSTLDHVLFPPDTPLFAIVSSYDMYVLSESIKRLSGNEAGLVDYVRTVFLYGGAMNESVEHASSNSGITLFMPSCTQHVYLATTSLWDSGQLFNRSIRREYSRGTVSFSYSISSGNWRKVSINNTSLQQAITSWYNSNYTLNYKLRDSCGTVLCNPTCPDQITFNVTDITWSSTVRATIIVAAIILSLVCGAVKLIMLLYQLWLIRYYNTYKTKDGRDRSFLPDCPREQQMNLACINLSYALQQNSSSSRQAKVTPPVTTQIIENISAYFNPAELVAVMGPSGCGKTTLLDVLTGRRTERKLPQPGQVLVNGIPRDAAENFVDCTGYVMQSATAYYEDLTVTENLLYSSILRLPKTMSWLDRFERVNQVMRETGLDHQANTLVGGQEEPGLSGGEKKRLCVALQLLSLPRILFLDEPTSGLDAASSLELLKMLHCLAVSGRTVILTIHQPRIEIYHMFDKIVFLCRGQVAYFGSPFKALSFFRSAVEEFGIELPVEETSNPADSIMDILADERAQEEILSYYKSSGESEAVSEAIKDSSRKTADGVEFQNGSTEKRPGLFLRMFALESRISAQQTATKLCYLPVLFLLLGLLMGSTYWQTHSSMMVMSVYCIISTSSAIFISSIIVGLMVQQLQIFVVECQDGVSKPVDMVLHVFMRVSAISVFPVILCVSITYLLITLKYNWTDFLSVLLIQLVVNHTWVAIFTLVVCCSPVMSPRICPLVSALAGFASGFIVARPNMPIYYEWLFPINPTYWGYAATVRIMLGKVDFNCKYGSQLECFPFSGLYVLELFGLHDTNPYQSIAVLLGILTVCLVLSIIILMMKYPCAMQSLLRKQFKYRKIRHQIHSWPLTRDVDSTSQQSRLYKVDGERGKNITERNSHEKYSRIDLEDHSGETLYECKRTMSPLLDGSIEKHKLKDNQSIEDRWELSSQVVNSNLPCCNHQAMPDAYYQTINSSATVFHGGNFSFGYSMNSRSVTSRYILEERRKRMEENLDFSSSLSIMSVFKQRSTSLHKQRPRPRQSLDAAIPFTGLQTEDLTTSHL